MKSCVKLFAQSMQFILVLQCIRPEPFSSLIAQSDDVPCPVLASHPHMNLSLPLWWKITPWVGDCPLWSTGKLRYLKNHGQTDTRQ